MKMLNAELAEHDRSRVDGRWRSEAGSSLHISVAPAQRFCLQKRKPLQRFIELRMLPAIHLVKYPA